MTGDEFVVESNAIKQFIEENGPLYQEFHSFLGDAPLTAQQRAQAITAFIAGFYCAVTADPGMYKPMVEELLKFVFRGGSDVAEYLSKNGIVGGPDGNSGK